MKNPLDVLPRFGDVCAWQVLGRVAALLAATLFCFGCDGGEHTMAYYEGVRPVEDVGPNQFSGAGAGVHYRGVNKGSNPRLSATVDSPPWLSASATGKVDRLRLEAKPNSVDTATAIKLFLIQSTEGSTFNPASGFMEFGLKVYKADGVTLLGSTTAHIANDYSPALPGPITPGDPYWEAQEYEFTGLSLSQADIDAGLILELDSTAADGWAGGGTWYVYAAWIGVTYSASEDFESLVTVTTPVKDPTEVWAPIGVCQVDAQIDTQVEVTSLLEGEV